MDKDLAGDVVSTWEDLVLFLGGSPDSFTGLLLTLIAKADPGNRARLAEAFPGQVAAWEAWCELAPLTAARLEALAEARVKTSAGGRAAFSFADLKEMFYLLGDRPETGHAKAKLEVLSDSGTIGISAPGIRTACDHGHWTASYEDEGITWEGSSDAGQSAAIIALLASRSGYKAVVTFKDDNEAEAEGSRGDA